jgi:hypothetical protein
MAAGASCDGWFRCVVPLSLFIQRAGGRIDVSLPFLFLAHLRGTSISIVSPCAPNCSAISSMLL